MSDTPDTARKPDATTNTPGDVADTASAHHRRWYQKPSVLATIFVAVAAALVLFERGTRRLRFETDTRPAGGDVKIDWGFTWSLVPDMLNGLSVTAMAAVFGFALAVVIGLVLAILRRSPIPPLRWLAIGFVEFIRSTPLLIQLYFLFVALPKVDLVGNITTSPNQALIIGLGIHYGTYTSEAFRAGINSVPKGQWEAITALNLKPVTGWTKVILPQAIPNVLPALGNNLIAAFKDAPLGFTVQVTGLMFFATTVQGRYFRPVEAYILIGIGFLLVSIPAAWLIRRLERRIAYERI